MIVSARSSTVIVNAPRSATDITRIGSPAKSRQPMNSAMPTIGDSARTARTPSRTHTADSSGNATTASATPADRGRKTTVSPIYPA